MHRLRHSAGVNGSFTRDFGLAAGSNRLATMTTGKTPPHKYAYDENGNLIGENTERHFEWDHSDRMRAYRTQSGNAPPSVYAQYLYDAAGQRVTKLVRRQGGAYEVTIYIDGLFEHHRLVDLPGQKHAGQKQATHPQKGKAPQGRPDKPKPGPGKPGQMLENNTLHVMDDQSRIAMARVGDAFPDDGAPNVAVKYHLGDHLGSSNVVIGGGTPSANDFINREEYFPYGETGFGSFAKKRYRFTGKERDEESGLYYFGARYYASTQCRFISTDRLLSSVDHPDPQTWNCYSYVTNNPVKYNDPTGERRNPVTGLRGIDPIPQSAALGSIRANSANPHVGEFGMVRDGGTTPHRGIDINGPVGTPLVAAESGIVVENQWRTGYGNRLGVRTSTGDTYFFSHLNTAPVIGIGETVTEGNVIAHLGITGRPPGSTEPHLHMEVMDPNGDIVDPVQWLNDTNANVPLEIIRPTKTFIGVTVEIPTHSPFGNTLLSGGTIDNISVPTGVPQILKASGTNPFTGELESFEVTQQSLPNPGASQHIHPAPGNPLWSNPPNPP